MRACRFVVALSAVLVASGTLHAQTITGSVVLPDSVTPAAGVIVVARNARDSVAARGLTGSTGHFTLHLPANGRYALSVLRIGYRPTIGPTVDVVGLTTAQRIVLVATPVTLATVSVRESETCRVNADTGLAVARLWQEARKAMLSAELGTDDAPLDAEWIEYDRQLDSIGRLVRHQTVRSARHPTTHAFRSLPAAELDTGGYVVEAQGGARFFAPDVEALLSDQFVRDHCFRLAAPPAAQPNLIGIAFQPTRDRRERRDIRGTLWLDRTSAELRSLEFAYTGLSEIAESVGAGGRVEFLRLHDGNWLVSRWSVRMPQLQTVGSLGGGPVRVVATRSGMVVRGVQVTGGEVLHVLRGDSTVYRATGASVDAQFRSSDGTPSVAGTSMRLDGTDYRASADSMGRIALSPVLDGAYHARFATPLMDSLSIPPVEGDIEARAGVHVDTIVMPSVSELLTHLCPRDSLLHGEGMLRGTLRDEYARTVAQAGVTVTWQGGAAFVDMPDGNHLSWTERTVGTLTTPTGTWRVCGVPSATPLVIRAITDSGTATRTVRLEDPGAIASVPLVLARTRIGERGAVGTTDAALAPAALLEIVVTAANGAPLPDARVEIVPRSGPSRIVVTGASGHALVPDLEPGIVSVRARRIGFKPGQLAVTVGAGRNTAPIVMSDASVPVLETVRVVAGKRTLDRWSAFETRRLNHTATASITQADIEKRGPVDTWQMLTGVASVTVTDRDSMVVATSARSMVTSMTNQPCYLIVMVDGTIMNHDPQHLAFDLRQLPPPGEIHGIEIFAGPGAIPLEYAGEGGGKWCGMIAIWTR